MLLELLFCVLKTIGISTAPPIQHERQYLIVILIYTIHRHIGPDTFRRKSARGTREQYFQNLKDLPWNWHLIIGRTIRRIQVRKETKGISSVIAPFDQPRKSL